MVQRVVDVTNLDAFERIPPCADGRFDHRTCDYWEDEVRGTKAHRASWLAAGGHRGGAANLVPPGNPFAPARAASPNPFARPTDAGSPRLRANPFGDDDEPDLENPFAPRAPARPGVGPDAPRKLQLLGRGLAIFGSYAKVLQIDGAAVAYCQFGPLSAYPRAQRVRDLYPQLPSAPLPAVITCIATTPSARSQGHAGELVSAVSSDLASRGFAAVEAYPEPESEPDTTSAANPAFWLACGFDLAVDDPRFPVVRLEL